MKKVLKRISLIFLLLIAFIAISSVVVSLLFKDEIKQQVETEISNLFIAELTFSDLDISLIRHFPNASISLNNINLKGSNNTLLKLNNLDLTFNPFSFLSDNYSVSSIQLNNGSIALSDEFDWKKIIKTSDEQNTNSSFNLAIKQIELNAIDFTFSGGGSKTKIKTVFEHLNVNGDFSNEQYSLSCKGDAFVKQFFANNINYVTNKAINLSTNFNVNSTSGTWTFNPSSLNYAGLPLNLSGSFTNKSTSTDYNVLAEGKQINLQQLINELSWLPAYKDEWQLNGNANISASYIGTLSKTAVPTFKLNLDWKDGKWRWDKYDWELNKVNLSGFYTNKTSSGVDKVKIHEFNAENSTSSINCAGAIVRLSDPLFNLWGEGKLDLSLLKPWLDSTNVSDIGGIAELKFRSKGKAQHQQLHWNDFFNPESEFWAKVTNGHLHLNNQKFENISAELSQLSKTTAVRLLTTTVNNTTLSAKGLVKNWVNYVSNPGELLALELAVEADNIALENWLNASNNASEKTELPNNIVASIKLKTKQFSYQTFSAENLYGLVQYSQGEFSTTGFRFKHANGTFVNNLTLKQDHQNWLLSTNTSIRKVNVKELFKQWNNFGQNTLNHNQISGTANAQALVNCKFNAKGFDLPSLYSLTDITIEKGSIKNNAALNDIGGFLKSNLIIKPFVKVNDIAENLNDLQFSKLRNLIEIKDNRIIIPEMDITTNALAMNVKGSHSFSQNIDYHFNFLLSDVLRRNKKGNSDNGISDNGKRIFIKATGSVDNPEFGLDRDEARAFKLTQNESNIGIAANNRFDEVDTTKTINKLFDWEFEKPKDSKKDSASTKEKTTLTKLLDKLEEGKGKEGKDKEDDQKKKNNSDEDEIEWEIDFSGEDGEGQP